MWQTDRLKVGSQETCLSSQASRLDRLRAGSQETCFSSQAFRLGFSSQTCLQTTLVRLVTHVEWARIASPLDPITDLFLHSPPPSDSYSHPWEHLWCGFS